MNRFYVQEHDARRRHWDLRLESGGALKSWALPKGPPPSPGVRRLAVRVPDHALSYGPFHGVIPKGRYGAGAVRTWDGGRYEAEGGVEEGLERGRLSLVFHGTRLRGRYALVRLPRPGRQEAWLMIKARREGRP